MNEIKGIISIDGTIAFTCCYEITNILIDGKSLHEFLKELEYQEKYSIRYVILDQEPNILQSFDELAGSVITNMLYTNLIVGCYSEWTCGSGDDDYFINNERSIFHELKSYEGKYIHLKL